MRPLYITCRTDLSFGALSPRPSSFTHNANNIIITNICPVYYSSLYKACSYLIILKLYTAMITLLLNNNRSGLNTQKIVRLSNTQKCSTRSRLCISIGSGNQLSMHLAISFMSIKNCVVWSNFSLINLDLVIRHTLDRVVALFTYSGKLMVSWNCTLNESIYSCLRFIAATFHLSFMISILAKWTSTRHQSTHYTFCHKFTAMPFNYILLINGLCFCA